MRSYTTFLVAIIFLTTGCRDEKRIADLEKQNKELKAEVEKSHAAADYDLQEKCSKDARAWFSESFTRDRNTLLLDYQNHYNKEKNACFIFVEFHWSLGNNGGWTNNMGLWNVAENAHYGDFIESHEISFKPNVSVVDSVVKCEVEGKSCKTMDDFNGLLRPYLNN